MFRRRERGGGFWRRLLLSAAGQSSTEYLGVTVVSALVVLAVAAASPELRAGITDATERAACTLQNEDDCNGDGAQADLEPLPGEVDPEAPRPDAEETGLIGESGTLGGAGSLEFASGPPGSGTTCFASTQSDCTTPGQGPEAPLLNQPGVEDFPELDPCSKPLNGPKPLPDVAACQSAINSLLRQFAIGNEEEALKAINGHLGEQGCAGFAEFGESSTECDAADREHIARHVLEHLDQYSGDEYDEHAEDVANGLEDVPETEPPPSGGCDDAPGGAPGLIFGELFGGNDLCRAFEALGEGDYGSALLNGLFALPGTKAGKPLKEGVEELAERGGKETTERGAREAVEAAPITDDISQGIADRARDAGITPINSRYAGKTHPETGIPFRPSGFPDFSGVATRTVNVPGMTGSARDFRLANEAAGYKSTPAGYTWHHVEDGKTMQLVPSTIHQDTRHTGGAALLRRGVVDPG